MKNVKTLVSYGRDGKLTNRICSIYVECVDPNPLAWREEVEENFRSICLHFGDNPDECRIVGEARWMWLRIGKTNRATVREEQFKDAKQVTIIRVHRKRGKKTR